MLSELKSIDDVDIPRNSRVLPDEPAVPLLPDVPEVPLVPDEPAVPLVAPKTLKAYEAVNAYDAVTSGGNKLDPVSVPFASVCNTKLLPLIYISSQADPFDDR